MLNIIILIEICNCACIYILNYYQEIFKDTFHTIEIKVHEKLRRMALYFRIYY